MRSTIQLVNTLAERIHDLRGEVPRQIVGIAGAPGSGKSTLAVELARRLQLQKVPTVVVPQDGFHLDNQILDAWGMRSRKGAPETFDAAGFVALVRRIRGGETVFAPVFDRARDISIGGAEMVSKDCAVVIVEGNYLLLDEAPWHDLVELFDLSAFLDVDLPDLRARLIQRWLSHGLSRAAATRRAEQNDLANAGRVIGARLPCDLLLR